MAMTMFERYGGFAGVRKVVSQFYDKVLDSDQLQQYFVNTDMRSMIDHQTKFVATLMGGPASYSDEQLRRVHQRLNITQDDFVESLLLLREAMEDCDFEERDIVEVCDRFEKRKPSIVMASE